MKAPWAMVLYCYTSFFLVTTVQSRFVLLSGMFFEWGLLGKEEFRFLKKYPRLQQKTKKKEHEHSFTTVKLSFLCGRGSFIERISSPRRTLRNKLIYNMLSNQPQANKLQAITLTLSIVINYISNSKQNPTQTNSFLSSPHYQYYHYHLHYHPKLINPHITLIKHHTQLALNKHISISSPSSS